MRTPLKHAGIAVRRLAAPMLPLSPVRKYRYPASMPDTPHNPNICKPIYCSEEAQALRSELLTAKAIVEKSPVVLFKRTPHPDYKLVYVSENISRFGYSAQELMDGRVQFKDLIHPEDQERMAAEVQRHEEDGTRDYGHLYRILTRDGEARWVEDTTSTITDGDGNILYYHGVVVDVTERQQAQEELRRSEAKLKRILETAAEGFVLLTPDLRIVDVNPAYCAMLGHDREELLGRQPQEFATPEFLRFLQANQERLIANKVRIFEGRYYHKNGREVPVLVHGSTLTDHTGQELGHVGFVTDMTEQKRSLLLAKEVQQNLLPKEAPRLHGLDLAGRSVPWEEIGGDYFDYLPHDQDGTITIAVGDIAGHGVDSALLMTTARAVLRDRLGAAKASGAGLGRALSEVNTGLYRDFLATARFMTMLLLSLEPGTGKARWVRAGHDPAMVYYPDADEFGSLDGHGLPLGVVDETEYETNEVRLDMPCIIAVGTDGIWETRNPAGEMFGKERLQQLLRQHAGQPAKTLLERVFDAVYRFAGGVRPEDDVTLVIAKLG